MSCAARNENAPGARPFDADGFEAAYYLGLLAPDSGLVVRAAGPGRGKGVFATRAFEEGEAVLERRCWAGVQENDDEGRAAACRQCMRTLEGTVAQQLERCGLGGLPAAGVARLEALAREERGDAPAAPDTPVPCRNRDGGCGCEELYCSQACADLAWAQHHSWLCTGDEDRGAVAGAFRLMADHSNKVFHLVARVIARVLSEAESRGCTVDEAALPLRYICRAPWWDVAMAGPGGDCCGVSGCGHPGDEEGGNGGGSDDGDGDGDGGDDEKGGSDDDEGEEIADLPSTLRELVDDATALLRGVMAERAAAEAAGRGLEDEEKEGGWERLLEPGFVSELVGMFEMNNWAMVAPGPLGDAAQAVAQLEDGEREALAADLGGEEALEEALEAAEDWGDASGTGFYALGAAINHSCDPNAALLKAPGTRDNRTTVIAQRDIAVGEEVCISYIDEDADLEERRGALAEYQFVCACPRCERDEAGADDDAGSAADE